MKKLLWGKNQTIHFEPSGNYIYRIHPKEIAKKLAAVGCPALAWKTFNDIYLPKYGKTKADHSLGFVLTRIIITLMDLATLSKVMNPGLIAIVAFKEPRPQGTFAGLKDSGMHVKYLPENPYC
jgi:hypothetical protein